MKKNYSQTTPEDLIGVETVIHLANIANDPSVDLNPTLSWETNTLFQTQFLELCKRATSIQKFIYASSGSVYGIKEEDRVTEELIPIPISVYNKTKMVAERVALSYSDSFNVHVIRPATVCGVSSRMRFDVVVNMFVLQAFKQGEIKVLGGKQIRPNIHIDDMVRIYCHFLENRLSSGIYNAGFENMSILEIANIVREITGVGIRTEDSNDPRSYRQDSSKLISTGFSPSSGVRNAIVEIYSALQSYTLIDRPEWHTVSWMKSNHLHLGYGE
jgi:nucleoside-diphosphate-sugar epimerase